MREEPRHRTENYWIQILTKNPPAWYSCEVLDVSGSGLRVRANCPIETGAEICLTLHDQIIEGKTCYCMPRGESFEIGVQMVALCDQGELRS
jgi:hypothetical protein